MSEVEKKPQIKRLKKKRALNGNVSNIKPKEAKVEPQESDTEGAVAELPPAPPVRKERWTNRTRVLIFSSRGVSFRLRHLMNDVRALLPHSKSETKLEKKERLESIIEICEMRNCQVCLFFEMKRQQDAYLWVSRIPDGPSVKFCLENAHTMQELRMTGNCLKGSRPILAFARDFETEPHWRIIRELFAQVFNTPNHHPKSQPFVDHVLSFSIADSRIWFRNFQIADEAKAALTEIGPRFALNPVAIFSGSFGGPVLWHNPDYVSPNLYRRALKIEKSGKYRRRVETKMGHEERLKHPELSYDLDPTDELFDTTAAAEKRSAKRQKKT